MKKVIRVLHIDDEASYLQIIKIILERQRQKEIKVDSLSDPKKLVETLSQNKYDVILCDYIMNPTNGLEVLSDLREKKIFTPFILLTGRLKNAKIIRKINSYPNTRYMLKNLDIKTTTSKLVFAINSLLYQKKN